MSDPASGPNGAGQPGAAQHLLLAAFAEELERCGMRGACISPGSRNTPLILALARRAQIDCFSHIDERSGGFFALGMAKAVGLPVAITCTSGTAVAELMPAVVEAREASVPLLVLSADRPAQLRDCGAGQAIDQLKIFGSFAKWFVEAELRQADEQALRWIRTLACRAYWQCLEGRPGPVHINFPLREPLAFDERLPSEGTARPGNAPYLSRRPAPEAGAQTVAQLREYADKARRGLLVIGRFEQASATQGAAAAPGLARAAADAAAALGWPLLADPMSGARRGPAAIAHYDAILREPGFAAQARPDLIVRLGALPVSKPLRSWLAGQSNARQVAIDPIGDHQDPDGVLDCSLPIDPLAAAQALGGAAERLSGDQPAACEWLGRWRAADELAAEALTGVLADEQLSDMKVAAELGVLLPAQARVFVASSMPIRDIESLWPVRSDPPRVLCNRGANGIDGVISSAFGLAAAERDLDAGPALALIGDVAMAHDIGGLIAARRLGLKLTIVLIDNGGGAIFDFLPIGASRAAATFYEQQIATPSGLDFAATAQLFDIDYSSPLSVQQFRTALEQALESERTTLIHVRSERAGNRRLHTHALAAVADALGRL